MFHQTFSSTYYIVYGSVMMGLLVCSLLSPLLSRTVDVVGTAGSDGASSTTRYECRLYGLLLTYQEPPPPEPVPPLGPGEGDDGENLSSSMSSSSMSSSSSSSWSEESSPFSSVSASASEMEEEGMEGGEEEGVALSAVVLGFPTQRADVTLSSATTNAPPSRAPVCTYGAAERWGKAHARDASGVAVSSGSVVASETDSSSSNGETDSSISSDSDDSTSALGTQHQFYLRDNPYGAMRRACIAYLVFLSLGLVLSFVLVLMALLQVVPAFGQGKHTINILRGFMLTVVFVNVACMGVAAALVTQNSFFAEISEGFYLTTTPRRFPQRHLRSGFSCLVATAVLSVLAIIGIPFIKAD